MRKRGQITVFIIVGIVVLAIVLGMVYLSQYLVKDKLEVGKAEAGKSVLIKDSVSVFVDACLRDTAEKGIYFLGKQGGYYDIATMLQPDSSITIPFYFYLGENYFPERELLESELSKYIQEELPKCIDFTFFEEQGYRFVFGDITVDSKLGRKVIVDLDYPISFSRDGVEFSLDRFNQVIDFNFEQVYGSMEQVLNEQNKNTNEIPLGFITNLAWKEQFKFEIVNLDRENIVYIFFFDDVMGQKEPYVHAFMVGYNWSDFLRPIEFPMPESEPDYVPVLTDEKEHLLMEEGFESEVEFSESLAGNDIVYSKKGNINLFSVQNNENNLFIQQETDGEIGDVETDWKILSAAELASALANNEIDNLNLIDDWNFAGALNNDPTLLDNEDVFGDFNRRIKGNIELLNANEGIKERWFDRFDILCIDCNLESFDGENAITRGEKIKFNPEKFPLATVSSMGEVILANGVMLSKEASVTTVNGAVDIEGGEIDFSSSENVKDMKITGGQVIFNSVYHAVSEEPIKVSVDGVGVVSLAGKEALLKDYGILEEPRTIAEFTGEIVVHDPHRHFTFAEGTEFVDYKNEEKSTLYTVTEKTEYYSVRGSCTGSNCIEKDSEGVIKIFAEGKNNVGLETIDDSTTYLKVNRKDNSKVFFSNQGKAGLILSENPALAIADPKELPKVEFEFEDGGETHTQMIVDGKIFQCSECAEIGDLKTLRSPRQMVAYMGEWAKRTAADDKNFGAAGGCYGVYCRDSLDEPKRLAKDYCGKKYCFDCIRYVTEALKTETRSEAWHNLKTGVQISQKLIDEYGFEGTFYVLDPEKKWKPYKRYSVQDMEVRYFSTREDLENALRDVPAGSPGGYFDSFGVEHHSFIKMEGLDTAEAHILSFGPVKGITVDKNKLERHSIMLITSPPKRISLDTVKKIAK